MRSGLLAPHYARRLERLLQRHDGAEHRAKRTGAGGSARTLEAQRELLDLTKVSYSPGGVGDIEVVTLYYAWPIYVSLLGNNLSNMGSNRLLIATAVFRNEPYQ